VNAQNATTALIMLMFCPAGFVIVETTLTLRTT